MHEVRSVAHASERRDPRVDVARASARESRSQSRLVGVRSVGQRVERRADPLERDAGRAAGLDQRDAPQHGAVVAALVAVVRRDAISPSRS